MKEAIVNILEGLLVLFIVAVVLAGFMIFGTAGPSSEFYLDRALLGGIIGLLIALLPSGVVFVLLVIRDQQAEQITLLRQIGHAFTATNGIQDGMQMAESMFSSTRSESGLVTPPTHEKTLPEVAKKKGVTDGENDSSARWEEEVEVDLTWIAKHQSILSEGAVGCYNELGRGTLVVDTTISGPREDNESYWYESPEEIEDEQVLKLVETYDPEQEFVVALLKHEDRCTKYAVELMDT